MSLLGIFKSRGDTLAQTVPDFAHAHRDLILIAMDPKTDEVFVCYQDKAVRGRIRSADGKKTRVLRALLWESQFQSSMDGVLVALVDIFKVGVRLPAFNQMAQTLDGALYNISKSLRKRTKASAPTNGAIKSPFVDAAGRPQL